jgi:hypothetical protein
MLIRKKQTMSPTSTRPDPTQLLSQVVNLLNELSDLLDPFGLKLTLTWKNENASTIEGPRQNSSSTPTSYTKELTP